MLLCWFYLWCIIAEVYGLFMVTNVLNNVS